MQIQKSSGAPEPFSEQKLHDSLLRSGASDECIARVLKKVERQVRAGVTTQQLHQLAFTALKKEARGWAARYNLKHALMQLGPSGYPFEHYAAALFEARGYRTQTGQILQGACVTHEVDVLAERGEERLLVECKYRNQSGRPCDVKVALYVHARAEDLRRHPANRFDQFWLITNSRFTTDAIQYGQCVGLRLMGWDYPSPGSLEQAIEGEGLYPITCLTSLKRKDKDLLLGEGVVLCKTLVEQPRVLDGLRLRKSERTLVLEEASELTRAVDVRRWAEKESRKLVGRVKHS